MNNYRAPGGTSHGGDQIRRDRHDIPELRAALHRAAAAQQESTRLALQILDRLEQQQNQQNGVQQDTGQQSRPRRPDVWPTTPTVPTTPPPARTAPVNTSPVKPRDNITLAVSVLGAAITVIGLVFLAVQAFSRGWLGPGAAVTIAAVLCMLLVVAAVLVHRRSPDGPAAPALLATGVLGALTDLWVVMFALEWLDTAAGVGLGTLITVGGLATAWHWRRQALAAAQVIVGALFITPTVLHLLDLTESARFETASLTILALVGAVATWQRRWPVVQVSSGVVFAVSISILVYDGDIPTLSAAAAIGVAIMTSLSTAEPFSSPTVAAIGRWIPVSVVPVLYLTGLTGAQHDSWSSSLTITIALVIGTATASVGVVWPLSGGGSLRSMTPQTTALVPAAYCGIFSLTLICLSQQSPKAPVASSLWMLALLVLLTGVVLISDRLPTPLTWVLFGVVVLAALPRAVNAWFPSYLDSTLVPLSQWPVLVLLAIPGYLLLRRAGGLGATREIALTVAAVLGVIVSSAIPLTCLSISNKESAFMTGHLLMSVLWMGAGVAVLLRGNGSVGLSIAAAATAKLVFFDLAALSGLIQVAAFVICGVILLVSGVLRDNSGTKGSGSRATQATQGPQGPQDPQNSPRPRAPGR